MRSDDLAPFVGEEVLAESDPQPREAPERRADEVFLCAPSWRAAFNVDVVHVERHAPPLLVPVGFHDARVRVTDSVVRRLRL